VDVQTFLPVLPLWYAVFLFSSTAHEASHALAARLGGDDTAYLAGQLSLNPLPHIRREPFGTVLVPLLTFFMNGGRWMIGWASAPYDPLWEDRHPRRAALMALAGPLANLLLSLVAYAILSLGLVSGWWVLNLQNVGGAWYFAGDPISHLVVPVSENAGIMEGLGRFLSVLFGLNLVLFVFNLIPIWPLDGGTVLAGFFEPARRFREWLRRAPYGMFIGIVAAWLLIRRFFWPLFYFAVNRMP
jgi:Zn-dependent protease